MYSIAEYVLDLSALLDVIGEFPIYLIGHSLGGVLVMHYAGIYPDRIRKVVNIEGLGFPAGHRIHAPYSERLRGWVEQMRETEKREPRPYPDIPSAIARMKEANPHLSDEQARHLTLHGTNWNSDGSLIWKFDNYARAFPPYGHNLDDIIGRVECIRIGPNNNRAGGALHTQLPGGDDRRSGGMYDACAKLLRDRPRIVGRAAVDDDDLVVRVRLVRQRIETAADVFTFLKRGNDDRDEWEIVF